MKTLLTAVAALTLLSACATLTPTLNQYGQSYCAHPEADRALLRAQLDAITEGFKVRIECPDDGGN